MKCGRKHVRASRLRCNSRRVSSDNYHRRINLPSSRRRRLQIQDRIMTIDRTPGEKNVDDINRRDGTINKGTICPFLHLDSGLHFLRCTSRGREKHRVPTRMLGYEKINRAVKISARLFASTLILFTLLHPWGPKYPPLFVIFMYDSLNQIPKNTSRVDVDEIFVQVYRLGSRRLQRIL